MDEGEKLDDSAAGIAALIQEVSSAAESVSGAGSEYASSSAELVDIEEGEYPGGEEAPVRERVEASSIRADILSLESGRKEKSAEESVEMPTGTETRGVTIVMKDLVYSIKVKPKKNIGSGFWSWLKGVFSRRGRWEDKIILNKVSAFCKPGEITAIIGASGSGKTTLIDVIAGRKTFGTTRGTLLFDGKSRNSIKGDIGYIEQRDILIGELTVREMLLFTARLKLPQKWKLSAKKQRVDEVIKVLGLQDVADTRIGTATHRGISGGQQKRVAIGLEMLTNPKILFLDEPTSGLDSAVSYDVMKAVKGVANEGHTVLLTIHQPSPEVFALFDKLLLLAEGHGSAKKVLPYFRRLGYEPYSDRTNVADFAVAISGAGTGGAQSVCIRAGPRLDANDLTTRYDRGDLGQKNAQKIANLTGDVDPDPEEDPPDPSASPGSPSGPHTSSSKGGIMYSLKSPFSKIGSIFAGKKRGNDGDAGGSGGGGDDDDDGGGGGGESGGGEPFKHRRFQTGLLYSLWVLVSRMLTSNIRSGYFFATRIVKNLILALLISSIYPRQKNNQAGLFNLTALCFFFVAAITFGTTAYLNQRTYTLTIAANVAKTPESSNLYKTHTVISMRSLFNRERSGGAYRVSAYWAASMLSELPFALISALAFACISYWIVGFNPKLDRFIFFVLLIVSLTLISLSLGYAISATTSSIDVANAVIPLILSILMIFGGFLIRPSAIPGYWIWAYYLSFFRYAFQAMVNNELSGRTFRCDPRELSGGVCPFTNGDQYLQTLGAENINKWAFLAILFGFHIFLRAWAYVALRFLKFEKR